MRGPAALFATLPTLENVGASSRSTCSSEGTSMRPHALAIALLSSAAMSLVASCTTLPTRTDATFAQVTRGMPEAEIQQMLGKPDETMRFPLSNTEAWDYRYYDNWGYMAIFSVTFDADGRVVSTISNRVNAGGDHAGSK
jgi:outer membrane protein assembly factor BamE (lipoprotein component of BamABCDE complex)